jgi:hypothetical protein
MANRVDEPMTEVVPTVAVMVALPSWRWLDHDAVSWASREDIRTELGWTENMIH